LARHFPIFPFFAWRRAEPAANGKNRIPCGAGFSDQTPMPIPRLSERIRTQVVTRFQQHGLAENEDVLETILIREGRYVGRRFRVDGASAVWIDAEQEIRIWTDSGELLDVLKLEDAPDRDVA
jgi:hypothetical protein